MGTGGLKLGDIKFNHIPERGSKPHEPTSDNGTKIAIIGMAGSVNHFQNLEEFWELLKQGREAPMGLSENRLNDINEYLSIKGMELPKQEEAYVKGTFFEDITGFDANFFGISQTEASMMDPNQRIFLETAWHALEDAGLAHDGIKQTDTGVYVGYSSDFGVSYREMFKEVMSENPDIAVSGNIESITASRISYLLDLRGPAVVVDTACSSGLTALYMAYRALQNQECKMAVAGSVNCNVLPLVLNKQMPVGTIDIQRIHSPDAHTRTFDDRCQGTVNAEGSFAFVLKPLKEAQRDRDRILAVIIGGAINQDGCSNGLTAPNSKAQEELITKAITDAKIPADSISYLEAHGTATPLGDPVEISGIQNAFHHFTDKKQFCAIGSLKTNIGHLDNASGLGSVAKVIQSMRHGMLPASLHFNQPNRNISFIQSPVFVNTHSVPWKQENGYPLRAGINSFGLSGTNCHIIIESWNEGIFTKNIPGTQLILPISAKSSNALRSMTQAYAQLLRTKQIDICSMAYTATACRKHYPVRLGVVFRSQQELAEKLEYFLNVSGNLTSKGIFFGEHRLVLEQKNKIKVHDITQEEKDNYTNKIKAATRLLNQNSEKALTQMAGYYIKGGDLEWGYLPDTEPVRKIELPLYPFEHTRCWINPPVKEIRRQRNSLAAEQCVQALGTTIAVTNLSASRSWELAEHQIGKICILPGTAYIEIMTDILRQEMGESFPLSFSNILFEYPFSIDEYTTRKLHILIENQQNLKNIRFVSRQDNGQWVEHVQASCHFDVADIPEAVDIGRLREQISQDMQIDTQDDLNRGLALGGRWQSSINNSWKNQDNNQFLVELSLQEKYLLEAEDYQLHPALLDIAVNAANNCIDNNELYLPLSYGSLVVYRRLPADIVVHLIRTDGMQSGRVNKFNVRIYKRSGELILAAENYCVISTSDSDLHRTIRPQKMTGYRQFFEKTSRQTNPLPVSGKIVLAGSGAENFREFEQFYLNMGYEVIVVDLQNELYTDKVYEEIRKQRVAACLFIWDSPKEKETMNGAVMAGFHFLKQWIAAKIKSQAGIIAITTGACLVTEEQALIKPDQAALQGLWRSATVEFESLNLRCLEIGNTTTLKVINDEIFNVSGEKFMAFYKNQRYLPVIRPMYMEDNEKAFQTLDGVVIISGGTGDLGLETAKLLADRKTEKIILLSSPSFPPREQWNRIITDNINTEMSKKLTNLIQLEKRFELMKVYPVNLGELANTKAVINQIRSSHGRISGIFHLAGRAGDGFLFHKSKEQFCSVYDGKANGAWNLHQATMDNPPDFFVSFSSITALVIEPGQTDYTAANMFLDALSVYQRQNGLNSVSIQWPAWKETGMAKRMDAIEEKSADVSLSTAKAVGFLDSILCNIQTIPPVWMPGQLYRADETANTRISAEQKPEIRKRDVTLTGTDNPSELQLKVAGIWADTLGVTTLDIDDDFNSLGGNSLLISKMLSQYELQLPGHMEIADLFTYTTVRRQADFLKSLIDMQPEKEQEVTISLEALTDVNEILALLARGDITVEESSELLAKLNGHDFS